MPARIRESVCFMSLPTWEQQVAAHAKAYGEEPSSTAREYLELANYFEHHHQEVVSFEILPSSLKPEDGSPLLVDGLAIAVGKKDLVKAFLYARNVFFGNDLDAYGKACSRQVHGPEKACAARIMLLFDPEHLTASNYLKRRLVSISHSQKRPDAAKRDLVFLQTLLTSPLHKHSKSPTLWYHRFWLVKTFKQLGMETPTRGRADRVTHTAYKRAQFTTNERIVVLKAADQHAKNYHAFQYFRRLWELLWSDVWIREFHFRGDGAAGDIIKRMAKWCRQNPRDISGWTFLIWICCQPNPAGHLSKTKAYHLTKITETWKEKLGWHGDSVDFFLKSMKMLTPIYFPRQSACMTYATRIPQSPISEERKANRRGYVSGPRPQQETASEPEPLSLDDTSTPAC